MRMKQQPSRELTILSSSIVSQLAPVGLINEYQIVLNPVVLGRGGDHVRGPEGKTDFQADGYEDVQERKYSTELQTCHATGSAVARSKGMHSFPDFLKIMMKSGCEAADRKRESGSMKGLILLSMMSGVRTAIRRMHPERFCGTADGGNAGKGSTRCPCSTCPTKRTCVRTDRW
jgi:hypothetical protein